MKTQLLLRRALRVSTLALLALVVSAGTSCTTTYDSAGRPVQSVDPGTAAAGALAAGVLGYAIASDRDDNKKYYYGPRYPSRYGGYGYNRPSTRHYGRRR
jgi:hypothetical protein